MKTYKDLQNFNNWSEREKNQFSISVIKEFKKSRFCFLINFCFDVNVTIKKSLES